MPGRLLETTLTGRNLLSPVLLTAARDVEKFATTTTAALERVGTVTIQSAGLQSEAATRIVASNSRLAQSAQSTARIQIEAQRQATAQLIASNTALQGSIDRLIVATEAQTTALGANSGGHRVNTGAVDQNTLARRANETATRSLAGANGLLGTSLTPLTAGLGALALGIGYAAYKAMDFDKSMSQVQAATQANVGTMGQLRAAAIQAGADTQYSATEAASGITELAKAGVSTADILGGGLTGALHLAAAGQIEVGDAAETAATALTVFRLSGDQVNHVADLLAAGAGKAQGGVGDLSMAMKQSALVASQMGLSVDDTVGALAEFASNGLLGSDAGTSFKTMLQRLNPQSQQAANLMDQLNLRAYDASGQFIGLAAFADKLQTALGGMTEEQRNATLNILYGSDAIRGASILYKDGADGVNKWTKNVNDAGYATRQAAQLQDNFAGDLEKLGGSVDTFFTSLGSGTQGPLRQFAQGLTTVVNAGGSAISFFSGLPGPIQAAVVAFLALVALNGPLSTLLAQAVFIGRTLAASFTLAAGEVGVFTAATAVARAAVGRLIATALPLAALIGVAYAVKSVVDFTNAGKDAADTVKQLNSNIREADGNQATFDAQSASIKTLKNQIADYKKTADAYYNQGYFNRTFINNPFGSEGDDAYNAQLSVKKLTAALQDQENASARADHSIEVLGARYHMTRDEVIAFADAHNINLSGGLEKTQAAFIRVAESSDKTSQSTRDAQAVMADFQQGLQDTADAADKSSKQIDLLKTSLDVLTGAHITLQQAQAAVYEATDAATGAIEKNKGAVLDGADALNLHTENGRKVQDVLIGIADKSNDLIATMEQQGATTAEATAKDAELRDSFYNTALQMTGSKDAAQKLTDQIYGIPADRTTKITADTAQATAAVSGLQSQIDQLAKDRTASINFRATLPDLNGAASGTGRMGTYSSGGYTGPGGRYTPVGVVHAGEVVFSQDDVAAHGGPTAVENMRLSRHGYANGGLVRPGFYGNVAFTSSADTSSAVAGLGQVADKLATAVSTAVQSFNAATSAVAPGGSGVERWRPTVLQALAMLGQSPSLANGVLSLIKSESGGNPNAINLTDSNARAGHPSRGLMQTIPSTFEANRSPNLPDNIVDPLANIYAGINYALKRYGPAMLAAGGRHTASGGYLGYDEGGLAPAAGLLAKATVKPERVLSPDQTAAFERWMDSPAASPGYGAGATMAAPAPVVTVLPPNVSVRFLVDGREFHGVIDTRIEAADEAAANLVHYGGGS